MNPSTWKLCSRPRTTWSSCGTVPTRSGSRPVSRPKPGTPMWGPTTVTAWIGFSSAFCVPPEAVSNGGRNRFPGSVLLGVTPHAIGCTTGCGIALGAVIPTECIRCRLGPNEAAMEAGQLGSAAPLFWISPRPVVPIWSSPHLYGHVNMPSWKCTFEIPARSGGHLLN